MQEQLPRSKHLSMQSFVVNQSIRLRFSEYTDRLISSAWSY